MLWVLAITMAIIGFGWVTVRRKRKGAAAK